MYSSDVTTVTALTLLRDSSDAWLREFDSGPRHEYGEHSAMLRYNMAATARRHSVIRIGERATGAPLLRGIQYAMRYGMPSWRGYAVCCLWLARPEGGAAKSSICRGAALRDEKCCRSTRLLRYVAYKTRLSRIISQRRSGTAMRTVV